MRTTAFLGLAPVLASCQLGVDIRVTGPPSAPVFELAEAGWFGGDPPALGGLMVEMELGPGRWKTLWTVGRESGCAATARIAYGEVPPGFTAGGRPAALEAGRIYLVTVIGCGHSGGTWFKPLADRILFEQGTGDAPLQRLRSAR